ncbi:MAG: hypothetical protein QW290_10110 [Sulfolobales archaeon]
MSITPEIYDFVAKIVEDKVKDIKVSREEFEHLRRDMNEHFRKLEDAVARLAEAQLRTEEGLKSLAEAQRRTEERLNALAEAQQRTEERVKALAEAQHRTEEELKTLAEAQKRTEERLSDLAEAQKRTEERVNALAEAQKRTEERLNALAEAQRMTEERLNSLAEAQKRTEEAIIKLTTSLDALRVEVGRLSETVGFGLEDIARVVLPRWIYASLGIKVDGLRREFVEVDGREIEINLYGEGELRGEKVIVVGEVKSRIFGSEVRVFYDNIYAPIAGKEKAKVVGVLFGYLIHPSAKKLSEELGLYVVASYE